MAHAGLAKLFSQAGDFAVSGIERLLLHRLLDA
jgi:hypothetical protein